MCGQRPNVPVSTSTRLFGRAGDPCADDAIKGEEAISRGADMRDLLSVLTLASGDAWT